MKRRRFRLGPAGVGQRTSPARCPATFANAEKAAEHAKEMNDHIGQLADKVKELLGPAGKDVAAALRKGQGRRGRQHGEFQVFTCRERSSKSCLTKEKK